MIHQLWKIQGVLTSEKISSLKEEFRDLLRPDSYLNVDLESVKEIDLAGFNFLINMYMSAQRTGMILTFSTPMEGKLDELIKQTKLDHVFR